LRATVSTYSADLFEETGAFAAGTPSEVGIGSSGTEAGHGYARRLQFVGQGFAE
jgi:hypothetical protein